MKRAISMLGAIAAVAIGLLFAAEAANAQSFPNRTHGGITCTDYRNYNPGASYVYPNTGNYFVCSQTGFVPSLNKANVPNGAINTLRANATFEMSLRNATFYLFKDRASSNAFMSARYGTGSPAITNTAQCGNTAQTNFFGTQEIVVSLFNTCSYTSTETSNSDLNKTARHEAGHAYDFAIGRSHAINPSRSVAFKGLADFDHTRLTPQSTIASQNWPTMTATQRAAYICQMFSTLSPSALEAALGANPSGFSGQVCTNGTATGLKSEYKDAQGNPNKTPMQIADLKMPYFVNPSVAIPVWQDLWAEEFSFLNGGQGINAAILKFTDNAMTSGVTPKPTFSCTRFVVDIWLLNGVPPTPMALQNQGCPVYQESEFYN